MTQPDPAQTYLQEAGELLEQLEQTLLDLVRAPADADLVNTAFRALHTIKGSGAMFGFDRVAAFTHHVETAFDLVRKGNVAASPELIAVTLAAKDHIRRLIEAPDSVPEAAGEAILVQLRAAVALPDFTSPPGAVSVVALSTLPSGTLPSGSASRPTTWRLRFRLPADTMAMGTNPLLLLNELRELGPCVVHADISRIPPLETLDPTECHVGWEVMLTTSQSRGAIEQVFLFELDGMQLELEALSDPSGALTADAPLSDAEPSAVNPSAAKAPAVTSPETKVPTAQPPIAKAPAHPPNPPAQPPSTQAGGDASSIRVPAARLDDLMDRVGELVIAQSRLKQVAAASTDLQVKAVAEEIERLALELRDSTMGARMVPIGQLFGRFRRLVHDLAHDLGKEILLVTEGEETEFDKTLIERLGDPLVHLIRNAADHGLESSTQRLAAGKPVQGRTKCQFVCRVAQLRGDHAAAQCGRRFGLGPDPAGALQVLDPLARDIAKLQRDDRRGDLAAHLFRAQPHDRRGIARQPAVRLDRGHAGGEARRDRLQRAGVLANKVTGSGRRRPQMLPGLLQFQVKPIQAVVRCAGRPPDFGGKRQEVGARRAHGGRHQARVHRQHLDLVQDGVHVGDAPANCLGQAGKPLERGHVRLRAARQSAEARRDGEQILPGLGKFAAAQLAKQRLEGCDERGKNADRLFQCLADGGEMPLRQAAQGTKPIRHLSEQMGLRHSLSFSGTRCAAVRPARSTRRPTAVQSWGPGARRTVVRRRLRLDEESGHGGAPFPPPIPRNRLGDGRAAIKFRDQTPSARHRDSGQSRHRRTTWRR